MSNYLNEEGEPFDFDLLERELSPLGVLPYSSHPITTMTTQADFTGALNLDIVAHMLPITVTQVTKKIRSKKKFQLDHYPIPGSILNSNYKKQHSGIVNSTKTPMNHSIAMVMSIKDKNITCKLYEDKLHMTGCKSLDHGRETVWYLLNHLARIKRILEWIYANEGKAREVIDSVASAVLGETQIACVEREIDGRPYLLVEEYPGINQGPVSLPTIPADQIELVDYLLFTRQRFTNHDLLKQQYHSLIQVAELANTTHPILSGPFECKHISSHMVNHNNSLGFKVNREALNSVINGKYGFNSSFLIEFAAYVHIGLRYDTKLRTGVTLDGRLVPLPQTNPKKKKKEEHLHTIIVWNSGQVVQSGPETIMCREAYLLFMKVVQDNVDIICADCKYEEGGKVMYKHDSCCRRKTGQGLVDYRKSLGL